MSANQEDNTQDTNNNHVQDIILLGTSENVHICKAKSP